MPRVMNRIPITGREKNDGRQCQLGYMTEMAEHQNLAILVEPGHTTGFHRGSYSRDQSLARCLIMKDVSGLRIGRELTTYLLRDRPEVAQHARISRRPRSARKVWSPCARALVKLSMCSCVSQSSPTVLRASPFGARLHLLHDFVFEIVDDVTVAIDYHRCRWCREPRCRARTVVEIESVAALPLPDDALAAVEHERRFLRVGELPIVGVVEASARRDHAARVVDAEQPTPHVDLVRSVVADLAGSPVGEPVPVVVDDVVAIGSGAGQGPATARSPGFDGTGTTLPLPIPVRVLAYHARARYGVPMRPPLTA